MANPKRFSLALAAMLLLALTLAACGETATPVVTTTSQAAVVTTAVTTTAATTTAAATTAIPATTTAAMTSPATTTAATTAMMATTTATIITSAAGVTTTVDEMTTTTTMPASTPAVTKGGGNGTITNDLNVPSISGLDEIKISPSMLDYFNQSAGQSMSNTKSNIKIIAFKYYGSNDDTATVDNNVDTALKAAGYKFLSLTPGETKLDSSGKTPFGIYSKDGSPDLLVTVLDPKSSSSNLDATPPAGTPLPAGYNDFINQLKSKKTVVGIVGATGYAAMMGQMSGMVGTVTAMAQNATPTTK